MKKVTGIIIGCCLVYAGIQAQTRVDTIRQHLLAPEDGTVLVVAHRGDWRNACENSLQAIEYAIRMKVDIVELDLQQTKDGELILMHDKKLDRTTTGKGKVSEMTLEEIRHLHLKNGCGIRTIHKVPTLKETLLAAKGRVMLNLDKAFEYFEQVVTLLEETGTSHQVILKSDCPAKEVKQLYGKYLDKIIFMPKVNLDKEDAIRKLDEYLTVLHPVAVELKFAAADNILPRKAKEMMKGKSRIWYNTLWSAQVGGYDDDRSLENPDDGYGYLIDSLGTGIIQTDRPIYLKRYLKKRTGCSL